MIMSNVKIKMAAVTNMGLVRKNNEDNYCVVSNISNPGMQWSPNAVLDIGKLGTLLVVADGMGGMNAGEVASAIAIDVVTRRFRPELVTPAIVSNTNDINAFMKETIEIADNEIKEHAKNNPETKGMGTTIVMAWLIGGYAHIAWCGDSRAYVYNPEYGLIRLMKDHSFVQTLVDQGKLTEDEAFDYPDSNVITNCMCDASIKAIPECAKEPHALNNNDIILLCSDGLCGMIRDHQIENVVYGESDDMLALSDKLVEAALNASGSDNVTICLAKVLSGGKDIRPEVKISKTAPNMTNTADEKLKTGNKLLFVGVALAVIAIIAVLFSIKSSPSDVVPVSEYQKFKDSLAKITVEKARLNYWNNQYPLFLDSIVADKKISADIYKQLIHNPEDAYDEVRFKAFSVVGIVNIRANNHDIAQDAFNRMYGMSAEKWGEFLNEIGGTREISSNEMAMIKKWQEAWEKGVKAEEKSSTVVDDKSTTLPVDSVKSDNNKSDEEVPSKSDEANDLETANPEKTEEDILTENK